MPKQDIPIICHGLTARIEGRTYSIYAVSEGTINDITKITLHRLAKLKNPSGTLYSYTLGSDLGFKNRDEEYASHPWDHLKLSKNTTETEIREWLKETNRGIISCYHLEIAHKDHKGIVRVRFDELFIKEVVLKISKKDLGYTPLKSQP